VLLPSVSLTIGGKAVILAPAHVSTAQGLGGASLWAGNLGDDLLNQAHSVTVDTSTRRSRGASTAPCTKKPQPKPGLSFGRTAKPTQTFAVPSKQTPAVP
jgi:hypothetical protein